MKQWSELPRYMQCPEVKEYYDALETKQLSLFFKRVFDIVASILLLVLLLVPMIIICIMVVCESEGDVFYRQERVTTNGKIFRIHKFRTMIQNADKVGTLVTVNRDPRVTRVGHFLRKYRLDEIPQLIDILEGNMSFVGTRPEVPKYVNQYSNEMLATLLLPAGVTSEASIRYKDEAELMDNAEDADRVYVEQVLPEKMKYNLESIRNFSFWGDFRTMFRTIAAVLGKDY